MRSFFEPRRAYISLPHRSWIDLDKCQTSGNFCDEVLSGGDHSEADFGQDGQKLHCFQLDDGTVHNVLTVRDGRKTCKYSDLTSCPRGFHMWVPVWKSKFYGAFVLNRRVVLHAIDATPARWRGDAGSSPLD